MTSSPTLICARFFTSSETLPEISPPSGPRSLIVRAAGSMAVTSPVMVTSSIRVDLSFCAASIPVVSDTNRIDASSTRSDRLKVFISQSSLTK